MAVDATAGLGKMAVISGATKVGAAIGTAIPVPVVGTVVGAATGFVCGVAAVYVYDVIIDGITINGRTIKKHVRSGVERLGDKVVEGAAWAGDKVTEGLNNAKDAVGGLFKGIGSAVSSVFA